MPAEGVYLALEVKSSPAQLGHAIEQCASIKKLRKLIRPETTYFGFTSPPGKAPDPKGRTRSPDAGIWIWPGESENVRIVDKLDHAVETCLSQEGNDRDFRIMFPTVVFIPGNFLAFKVYPRNGTEPTAQHMSEYWYCRTKGVTHRESGDYPVYYTCYDPGPEETSPCHLHVFTLWLCQELLKFVHEVPDLFTYAFSRSSLSGRQGYAWSSDDIRVLSYNGCEWNRQPTDFRGTDVARG